MALTALFYTLQAGSQVQIVSILNAQFGVFFSPSPRWKKAAIMLQV
jgi:hypothetical protein